MSRSRTKLCLVVWAILVVTGITAFAQDAPNSALNDVDLFNPEVGGGFGGGRPPNEGYFFSWEQLLWSIRAPAVATIGNPNVPTRQAFLPGSVNGFPGTPITQVNSLDTSYIESVGCWGQRFEFGDVVGHNGWMMSITSLRDQNQNLVNVSGFTMTVEDLPFGEFQEGRLVGTLPTPGVQPPPGTQFLFPLPINFDDTTILNNVSTWSIEANYIYRTHPWGFYRSGLTEVFLGVRYLQFDERFEILARQGRALSALNALDMLTKADNHIIAPQVGLRLWTERERWSFIVETRFFAGFNAQDIELSGRADPSLNVAFWQPQQFRHSITQNEFTPGAELRVLGKLQLARGLSLQAGYNALWLIDGIVRASRTTDYILSETQIFGITTQNNRESAFLNGLSFGVVFNR